MRANKPSQPISYIPGIEAGRSLWLKEGLASTEDAPRLEGDTRADVCIVGGGYTGLWTALRLKELAPSLDVVLLEADVCGGGPSGRNGGFVMSWWVKFLILERLCGTSEALRLCRLSASAVVDIGEFCRKHGIDAHFRSDGWLWTATNSSQVGAWTPIVAALEPHGERPFEELAAAEVERRSGTTKTLAGVFEKVGATVQPALLARGLRRVALEEGVRIFERSAMLALDRSRPPRVRTAHGTVIAERLVLAMNAWAGQLRELRHALTVIGTDMVATEPIPERLERIGLTNGVAISDARMMVHYWRTTRDGRIAFGRGAGGIALGGHVSSTFQGASPRAKDVTASFRWLYPMLSDARVVASWTGPVDLSPTRAPFFTRLGGREDILCGAGYSGNGVGPSFVGGRILAALALERDDEWSSAGLVHDPVGHFPREPIRFFGGLLVRAAIAHKEKMEDAGRRPGALTLRLAKLAPARH